MALKIDGSLTGLYDGRTPSAVYPRTWAASQVLGGVNDAGGDSGLEYFYNRQLQGTAGERRVVFDARASRSRSTRSSRCSQARR